MGERGTLTPFSSVQSLSEHFLEPEQARTITYPPPPPPNSFFCIMGPQEEHNYVTRLPGVSFIFIFSFLSNPVFLSFEFVVPFISSFRNYRHFLVVLYVVERRKSLLLFSSFVSSSSTLLRPGDSAPLSLPFTSPLRRLHFLSYYYPR